MKRILFLILVVSQMALFGQYDLRNGDMSAWSGSGNSTHATYWNSMKNGVTGSLSSLTPRVVFQSTDIPSVSGITYSVQMQAKSTAGIIANGQMTTGAVNAGAMVANTPNSNYNYTRRGLSYSEYNTPFIGMPDSISFWGKCMNSSSTDSARVNAVIHDDYDYHDPEGTGGSDSHWVGKATHHFAKIGSGTWQYYSVPFKYIGAPATTPAYILVTFTTNKTPGGGANGDELYVTDVKLIYNPQYLTDLKIAGVTLSNFHKDTLIYNYYLCPGEAIPVATYAGSSRADIDATRADINNLSAIITVKHEGNPNVFTTYTVNFIYRDVVQVPTAQDVLLCGADQVTLSATVGTNGTDCYWYSDTLSSPIVTGTSCSLGYCEKDTVLYVSSYNATTGCESYRIPVSVSVNAIPATPTVTNDTICGAGTIQLSAQVGTDGTVCRWYASNISTSVLTKNNSFSISADKDTSFWVSSYNATTGCESNKVQIKVIVNPLPQAPVVYNDSLCGSGSLTLNVQSPATGMKYIWYASDDTPLDTTANSYTQTFTGTSIVKVSTYNPQTGCESGKISVSVKINPIPAVPILITDYCLYGENVVIRPEIGNNGNNINWYDAVSGGNLLKTSLTDTLRNITAPDTYTFYISSVNTATSCESTREEVIINIYPAYNLTLEDTTVCNSFTWNDITYNGTGNHSQTFQSIYGCDSIVNRTITINLPVTTTVKDTTCQGNTYQKHGFDLIAVSSNTYRDTLAAVNGCDSIIVLDLKVFPNYHPDTVKAFICGMGASQSFFGRHLTEAGIYDTIIKTVHGCDSLVILDLVVGDAFREFVNVTKCHGETYFFKGENLTETGIYRDTLQASNGCDSIIILTLVINNKILPTILTIDTCSYYIWNDSTYTESTSHNVTFSAGNGCDSIVMLNLTINHPVSYQFNDTACVSYLWNGTTYITSGTYYDTLAAVNGCDSTIILDLIIRKPATYEFYLTECSSYEWKGTTYTTSGDYSDTLTGGANNGCDSVTILHLTINEPVTYEFNHVACGSYEWKNITYTASTVLADTVFGGINNGCDSITILNLTINAPVTQKIYDTACMSYQWKGNIYTESIILNDTIHGGASNNCDSIVIHYLTVNYPTDTITIYDAICQGYTYTENGFNLPVQTATGTHTIIVDCDTVIVLHLTVNRKYLGIEITRTGCNSYTWNDSTYYESGSYPQTFKTIHGCDSIVTLRLTINQSSEPAYITDGICQGETYTINGFNLPVQETAGIFEYFINPKNSIGCDSIINLTLTVHPAGIFHIKDTVMVGETYNKHGFNIIPEISGIYRDTIDYMSFHNCDSTIVLLLVAQKGTNIKEYGNVEQMVHLFPNPAQNQVTISASVNIIQVEVYNIDGKLLDVIHSADETEIIYNVNRYTKGLYFVKIQTGNGTVTKKLIIQ